MPGVWDGCSESGIEAVVVLPHEPRLKVQRLHSEHAGLPFGFWVEPTDGPR